MIVGALVGLAGSRPAYAQSDHVILVHGGVGEPIAGHLVDELVSLGITVAIVKSDESDLATIARTHGADAALRVATSKHGVEVWLDGTRHVTLFEESKDEENNPAALALRVVENLRGQLVIKKKPPAPAASIAPPNEKPPSVTYDVVTTAPFEKPAAMREPRIPQPAPTAARRALSLRIGPAVSWQVAGQGISEAGMAFLGVRYAFSRRWGADIMGLVPVISARLSSPSGVVLFSAPAVFAGVSGDVLDSSTALGITPGVGIGMGGLSSFAQPGNDTVSAHDGAVLFAMPYAQLGLTWRFRPALGIFLHTLLAVATPRPVIHLQGRPTNAYFGQPQLALESGLWIAL